MNNKGVICLGLGLTIACSPVMSRPVDRIAEEYESCIRSMGGARNSTVEACAGQTSFKAKVEINSTYKKLEESMLIDDPGKIEMLEKAQRAWIQYRNLHCELMGERVGAPMNAYCNMEMNVRRAAELHEILNK